MHRSEIKDEYNVDVILPKRWQDMTLYRLREDEVICNILVPEGFVTDGATVPRWLWALFPPVCEYFPAAIVHDYLLESHEGWSYSNRVFKRALDECGVSVTRRRLMMAAVRAYGRYRVWFKGDPK